MILARVAIVLACVAGFTEAKLGLLRCPQISTKSNFVASTYLGRWYEQLRYFNVFQIGGRCTTADYSVSGTNNVGVLNSQVDWIGTSTYISGTAYPLTDGSDGKYNVNFPSARNSWGNYWVIDTDYTKYAIVWSCKYYLGFHNQNLWILTRDKNAGKNDLENYKAIARQKGLDTRMLMSITQNC